MLMAILQARSLRGCVPLHQKQSEEYSAQVVESQDQEDEGEHVLDKNEASDDELEVEYQEAVGLMTNAKQRRAGVDRARQFFRKPHSSEDRKAQLDKLQQKFPCARCGHLGHRKDDNDCPAKAKVVNWEETEEPVTEEPFHFRSQPFYPTRELPVPRREPSVMACVLHQTRGKDQGGLSGYSNCGLAADLLG